MLHGDRLPPDRRQLQQHWIFWFAGGILQRCGFSSCRPWERTLSGPSLLQQLCMLAAHISRVQGPHKAHWRMSN